MPTNMPAMQGSAWLTQPIKDLVKNWKVDIASFLEDYVHEIEMVTISFDGGQTNLNFAEAALVIQGSACVYSRKVEYLYTLVYQMLDLLTTRKKKQQSSANSDGNHDNDASQLETTHHDEFLSLDDIPEKDTLDMKEDEMTQNTVHVIFRTPISLVPLAESEKGTTPLLSPTGEVLGNKSDFRLNTCSVHHQGIMLLDVTHLRLIETKPEEPNPGDLFSNTIADNTVRLACEAGGTDDLDMKNASDGGATMVGDCNDDLFDDDDPMVGILRDDEQVTVKVEPPVQTRQLRDRCSLRKQVQATPPKPAVNVYEPLDAYQADHIPEKPFKKGRTARIPLALQKAKSKRMPRTAAQS
ncbi:PREDICTED: condensin-2 complex subunit H2-like [Priapulus caudatus]|uniref:Condensin-2 complex subunit H2-like n=1 Tax=Priapulus caudatus TaxID=37621 RepID=A0ABM1EHI1_PRICU|nr:PREDICTED: condensin-2 complex subunit H2-like [Priapulus caudatus]